MLSGSCYSCKHPLLVSSLAPYLCSAHAGKLLTALGLHPPSCWLWSGRAGICRGIVLFSCPCGASKGFKHQTACWDRMPTEVVWELCWQKGFHVAGDGTGQVHMQQALLACLKA